MRNILLLCERFPFGNGECFVYNELASDIGNACVTLIPVTRRSFNRRIKPFGNAFQLDAGITMMGGKKNLLANFVKSVFNKNFQAELRELRRTKRLCAYNIRLLLLYFSTAICAYNYIKDNYHDVLSDTKNPAIVYAYWLATPALTSVFLKQRYPHIKTVARCHGFDCLQERAKHDYLVAMKLKLKSLDVLFPASSYAALEINTKYPGLTKVETRFLGTLPQQYRTVLLQSSFTIVSCSSVDANKNLTFLTQAMARLKVSDTPIRWVHFGAGPLLPQIKEQATQLLDTHLVTAEFKGACPNATVLDYFVKNNVHLFIHASKSEGGPVVSIMEALSFGTPVVALDAGGNRDSVVPEKTGFLLPRGSTPEDFAAAVKDVLELPETKYSLLRQSARQFWLDNFSAANNYPAFYRELEEIASSAQKE